MTCHLFTSLSLTLLATLSASRLHAEVQDLQAHGWHESAYATWSPVSGATSYNVYISPEGSTSWQQLDAQLVRQYPGYLRADALGLRAGNYQFRVVPVDASGELTTESSLSAVVTASAHDRSGFAHVGMADGLGAYRNDGTLRPGARVLYVWAGNARDVTCDVITSSKGATTTGHGLQDIITLYQKGYDQTPLAIRIIGTIHATDMDRFDSSEEGLQVKGKTDYSPMPITIEGVGDDATITGFGILCRNCHGTEFRNFAIMLCMDDCLSLDTSNSNVWIHHMDFFYGNTGGDADQAKGDGTVDIKGKSRNVTLSYCHFFDSGKCSLGGMKSEDTSCWHTYHHNWFDHSDSRHPRIRTQFFHVYNNYFDGNAKYGVGMTSGGSALVEANVFRACKYPMLTSLQGTDAEGDGTFSGEPGGVIKAFDNAISGERKVQYYDGSQTDGRWDAVRVQSRDEQVLAVAYSGSTPYNHEADLAARTTYVESHIEPTATVVQTVTGPMGAGRMNHGDFQWTFGATEDANYGVIAALKQALIAYQPTVQGFADGTPISSSGSGQGGETPGTDPDTPGTDPETPGEVTPITQTVICHFKDRKPSSAMVAVSGNYSDSKGTVTYEGHNYTLCVKMESATLITITPTGDCDVTLVFGPTEAGKRLKVDGQVLTTDAGGRCTFSARAGQRYELTKGDSINLFLILFVPTASSLDGVALTQPQGPAIDLFGRRTTSRSGLHVVAGQVVFVR